MKRDDIVIELAKKILAMTVDKKVMIDQNLHGLIEALKDAGINRVWDISKLGLDPHQHTEDLEIRRRIQKMTQKTPNSGILFITNNEKHFLSPKGFDVLVIPQPYDKAKLVETVKSWIILLPKRAQNRIFKAVKYNGKHGFGYTIEVK